MTLNRHGQAFPSETGRLPESPDGRSARKGPRNNEASRSNHHSDQGSAAETDLRSDRLVSVSQVEGRPVNAVEALEDLDSADRVWLEERLVEYEDLLRYLHDH